LCFPVITIGKITVFEIHIYIALIKDFVSLTANIPMWGGVHSTRECRWRRDFPRAPIQTGAGVHPASCTMGTGSHFQR